MQIFLFTMTTLITALYIFIIVSKRIGTTRLTSTSSYIVDNQPFQLNCSSENVPRGQAASFRMNGQDTISVRYEPTLSQCFGVPTSGQSPPFVCASTCSCSKDAKSYTWTFIGIMDTVNGTFACEMLFGEANSETDTIFVTKAEHPVKVQTINQVPAGPVNVDTVITLICTMSGGIPLANLSWNCSGLVNNTKTHNLTISAISIIASKYHNKQVCTCSAFHPIEYYRPEVNHKLSVFYPPDMEPVIQVLGDLKPLVAGDIIQISCSISGGNPIAKLSWNCPGNVSTNTDETKITSLLNVELKAEDDRKTCSCIAEHNVNHFNKSVHYILNILYFPNITKCDTTPNDGWIDEFQTVILRCEVRGNPLPNISWISSDETILKKDHNISESSLTIIKASCIQSGKYSFIAENIIRERTHTDSRYIEVFINCRPHIDLRRQILSKRIAVSVNQTYNFTSHIVAYPKPAIQWILPSSVHFRSRISDGFEHESTVMLTSPIASTLGEYTMFANNSKGNMLFSFTVVGEGVPTAPYQVFVTCNEKSALVTWQSEFNGGQGQTFNVKYWNFKQPNVVLISDTVNDPGLSNITLLEISGLIPASQYSFTVVAMNKYGDATSRELGCKTDENSNHNERIHKESILTQIGIPILSALVSALLVICVIFIRNKVMMSRKKVTQLPNQDGEGPVYDRIDDQNRRSVHPYDDPVESVAQEVNATTRSPEMNEAELSTSHEYLEMNDLPSGSSKRIDNGTLNQSSGSSNNSFNNGISSYDYTIMTNPVKAVNDLSEQHKATSMDQTTVKTVLDNEQQNEKDQTSDSSTESTKTEYINLKI